jgi:Ca2+-binding RTX toxin-like protein
MEAKLIFDAASLSEAAYWDFIDSTTGKPVVKLDTLVDILKNDDEGFSDSQADDFINKWDIIHQTDLPALNIFDSGFSATLFRRKTPDTNGEYTFAYAIRGTEGLFSKDAALADVSIVANGLAYHQIIDLFNDWQWLSAGKDKTYQVATLNLDPVATLEMSIANAGLGKSFESLALVHQATGAIVDKSTGEVYRIRLEDSDKVFTDNRSSGNGLVQEGQLEMVTGHSLGGHLASAFSRLFPDIDAPAITLNGAGYGAINSLHPNFFAHQNISNLFDALRKDSAFDAEKIHNFYGEKGLEVVTQDGPFLFQPGTHTPTFIESALKDTLGHGISQFTDSQAVMSLLKEIDPGLDQQDIETILNQSSIDPLYSLESIVDSLIELLDLQVHSVPEDRESLYQLIKQARIGLVEQSSSPISISKGIDNSIIQDEGAQGLSARYALVKLNPYTAASDDSFYDKHNQLGELDLYDADTQKGQLSGAYLSDRLSLLVYRNLLGQTGNYFYHHAAEGRSFIDSKNGLEITIQNRLSTPDNHVLFGSHLSDTLYGKDYSNHIYGGAGDDNIIGGISDDYLEGGIGDDSIRGSKGNDILFGMQGADTFLYDTGDGIDTIIHPDSQDQLIVNGEKLNGGTHLGGNIYISEDHQTTYVLEYTQAGQARLTINGHIIIPDFEDGDLGISLAPESPQPPLQSGSPYDDSIIPDQDIIALDNILYGGEGSDLLASGPGSDTLNAGADDDWIYSGTGDDTIYAGTGNDIIFPDQGSDRIYAEDGNDIVLGREVSAHALFNEAPYRRDSFTNLYGRLAWAAGGTKLNATPEPGYFYNPDETAYRFVVNYQYSHDEANGLLNVEGDYYHYYNPKQSSNPVFDITNNKGDVLATYVISLDRRKVENESPLYVDGGSGDDLLAGADGADLIIGGEGSDRLAGKKGSDHLIGGNDDDILLGGPGDDSLEGNTGNDILIGETGDDSLIGGHGDDLIEGDSDLIEQDAHGNDNLYGGDGADQIYGHGGSDTIQGGPGNDSIFAGSGDDHASGGDGNDTIHAGEGNDLLNGNEGEDRIEGQDGNDRLFGENGADYLIGGKGDDQINGGDGNDQLQGESGQDWLDGGNGNDVIHGGPGDDWLRGNSGYDQLYGGEGANYFYVASEDGVNVIHDTDGDDSLQFIDLDHSDISSSIMQNIDGTPYLVLRYMNDGAVLINNGMEGNIRQFHFADGISWSTGELIQNTLQEPVNYTLNRPGALYGAEFDDTLTGSQGSDIIHAGAGQDILAGNAGDDLLYGEEGSDIYRIGPGTGKDRIHEAFDSSSTIELMPGVSLNEAIYEKNGNDLYLRLGNSRDGAIINAFFNSEQTLLVRDAYGASQVITPESSISPPEDLSNTSFSYLSDAFIEKTRNYYSGLLRTQGFVPDSDETLQRTITFGTSKKVNHVNFNVSDEATDSTYYERKLNLLDSKIINSETVTTYTEEYFYNLLNAQYIQRGSSNHQFIDLEAMEFGGLDGARITGDIIPSHGTDLGYDPLTGDSQRYLEGYWLFPDGAPAPVLQGLTSTYQASNYQTSVNILNLTGGGANNEIFVGKSLFNIIDAGDGDDEINARSTSARQKHESKSIYQHGGLIPLTDTVLFSQSAPGSLIYGNDGNDHIIGSPFEDFLIGGSGNNFLEGGMGDDTYIISETSGNDTIFDDGWSQDSHGTLDTLILPDSVSSEDLETQLGMTLHDSLYMGDGWFGRLKSMHATLEIEWSDSGIVTVIIPHAYQQAGTGLDLIQFSDGQTVSIMELIQNNLDSSTNLVGRDNRIISDGIIYGAAGNDLLISTEGTRQSTFTEEEFSSIVIGGAGHDELIGSDSDDALYGAEIIEDYSIDFQRLLGSLWDEGNYYHGGKGHDHIWATAGSDLFFYERGDGYDEITSLLHDAAYENALNQGLSVGMPELNEALPHLQDIAAIQSNHQSILSQGNDTLRFGRGINPSDIQIRRERDNLIFQVGGENELVSFQNWYVSAFNQLNKVEFHDGTVWDEARLTQLTGINIADSPDQVLYANPSQQMLNGSDEAETLVGLSVNDTIMANDGDDLLLGGYGDDRLAGGKGNDQIAGGTGNDFLNGGRGDDKYIFSRGDGHDTIFDTQGKNSIQLNAEIDTDDVWLHEDGNDLLVSLLGSDDQLRIKNWSNSEYQPISRLELNDGAALFESQIQNLIDEMARFSAPSGSETTFAPMEDEALQATITASWQPAA